jgi:hypothetical protein
MRSHCVATSTLSPCFHIWCITGNHKGYVIIITLRALPPTRSVPNALTHLLPLRLFSLSRSRRGLGNTRRLFVQLCNVRYSVRSLIQNDPATRWLLQGRNVVGALITRLSDTEDEVVVEAAGALRCVRPRCNTTPVRADRARAGTCASTAGTSSAGRCTTRTCSRRCASSG